MASVAEGMHPDAANRAIDSAGLKRLAKFCELMVAAKDKEPKKTPIEELRNAAEQVAQNDVMAQSVAGCIQRHIQKSADIPNKLMLCWYLLDRLAKNNPNSFGQIFGVGIADLASEHMAWTNAKDEPKYSKLVKTWEALFGMRRCEEILRNKEIKIAAHQQEEAEREERRAKGLPEPGPKDAEEDDTPRYDSMALVLGGVRDGQVVEYQEPCKHYLLGLCTNPKCSKPHPPGQFGSMADEGKKLLGDWKCQKCGYKNPGANLHCYRRNCAGERPLLLVSLQKQQNFKEKCSAQFGYDPDEADEAVAHFKDTNWDEYRAERKRKYPFIWEEWRKKRPIPELAATQRAAGPTCHSCGFVLKPGAQFCTNCGAKQGVTEGAGPQQGDRDDMMFPSTRLTLPETRCQVSATTSQLLRTCRDILALPTYSTLLPDLLSALQQAAHDPTFEHLPQVRTQVVLRAISRIYSQWASAKAPNDPTPEFLSNLSAMQAIIPLQGAGDQEVFDKMIADASSSVPLGAPPVPPLAPAMGTVTL
eukprot:TRINITY_DN1589_c0_g3_i1.p1 TRINITY_DN1589_c0_g3~~TRINITY_DN1589_c0_g3_i1.p1  ORF type:complete len:531 (+),score=189.79 TRINITY_DN1589_c0_g3_i1:60-1652(+)